MNSLRDCVCLVIFAIGTFSAELANGQVSVGHEAICKTDWMYRAEMGISTHYFPYTLDGKEKIANTFQVKTVASQAAEVGSAGLFLRYSIRIG